MPDPVSVAIPVRNGGPLLERVLAAVRSQRLDRPVELLVADSGSIDGSRELARRHGAELIDVRPDQFSHGATRNLLAARASGTQIAFLTQDAVPADVDWLARLIDGFALAERVGLVFGPYLPRAGASLMVRRELQGWFASLSPDGRPQVERGLPSPDDGALIRRVFFTDANGCIDRAAWEQVPFREVAYAEDQLLARDMLAAGYAKVYRPDAAVIHSHDYRPLDQFRRSFDEWRGLREVHSVRAPVGPISIALGVQRAVRDDVELVRRQDPSARPWAQAPASARHHALRALGAALGSRADRIPAPVQRACSLERRTGFRPIESGS